MKMSKTLILLSGAIVLSGSAIRAVPQPAVMTPEANEIRVFPNPWRSDKHSSSPVTFDHLPPNATIKLFTVSGRNVKTLETTGTSTTWDRTNDGGESVASGVYLYSITDVLGNETSGKLAIVR